MKSARIALLLGTALIASSSFAFAQEKGGVINVATVGEPPTLDPMASTADLVGIVSQHMFETLYTFDKDWKPTPLLAVAMPEISADGKTYTIKLRSGVKFHDGTDMDATDVVASLERWTKTASRGGNDDRRHRGRRPDHGQDLAQHPLCAAGLAARLQQFRGNRTAFGKAG